MARRTHENFLAEMLEKVLAYNISQIIRLRKKRARTGGAGRGLIKNYASRQCKYKRG